MGAYNLDDVRRSYYWLGLDRGYAELNAYHPAYRQGQEHAQWNREHDTYPKIWYARTLTGVESFLDRNPGRTCRFGLSPRPGILKNEKGCARSAKEHEITQSQNSLWDFDLKSPPSQGQQQAITTFFEQTSTHFRSRVFLPPAQAQSGMGYHRLFAYPPIPTTECSDIAQRLRAFQNEYRHNVVPGFHSGRGRKAKDEDEATGGDGSVCARHFRNAPIVDEAARVRGISQ